MNLWGNEISDISFLKDLTRLTSLNLGDNKISDGTFLKAILENNPQMEISNEDFLIARTGEIILNRNPLEIPTMGVVRQGRKAVLQYFKNIEKGGKKSVNECKVLIIGDAISGKTTLIKRFLGKPTDKHEKKTDGIVISATKLKNVTLRKKDNFFENEVIQIPEIKLNLWDFGGQEIYMQAHHFFLTNNSLYVLVIDARADNDGNKKLYDGLRIIQSYGGDDSPIIVVVNQIDTNINFALVDKKTLREEGFKNPLYFCKISALYGNDFKNYLKAFDFSQFEKTIREALSEVKIITQSWPKNYFLVREKIEKLSEGFISHEKYDEICEKHDIQGAYSNLAKNFNELGIFTHFEDMGLNNTYIIKPEWATKAVYDILNAKELKETGGILKVDPKLWYEIFERNNHHKIYKKENTNFIKELIKKFNIGYEIEGKNGSLSILIPSALGIEQPKNNFDIRDENTLHLQVKYKTYLSYVFPKLMVKAHESLTSVKWRYGAIFEKKGANTKIIASENRSEIDIYVTGKAERRRSVMNYFWELLDEINKRQTEENYKYCIPIAKSANGKLEYADYGKLLILESRGKTNYQGENDDYPILEILGGFKTKDPFSKVQRDLEEIKQDGKHSKKNTDFLKREKEKGLLEEKIKQEFKKTWVYKRKKQFSFSWAITLLLVSIFLLILTYYENWDIVEPKTYMISIMVTAVGTALEYFFSPLYNFFKKKKIEEIREKLT